MPIVHTEESLMSVYIDFTKAAEDWLRMRRLSTRHAPELAKQFEHLYRTGENDERSRVSAFLESYLKPTY